MLKDVLKVFLSRDAIHPRSCFQQHPAANSLDPPPLSLPCRHADYKAGSAPNEDAFFEDAAAVDFGTRRVAGAIKAKAATKDGASFTGIVSCTSCLMPARPWTPPEWSMLV